MGLDTNVLTSGIAGLGQPDTTPGSLLRQWRCVALELKTSKPSASELERTLAKQFVPHHLGSRMLESLRTEATLSTFSRPVRKVALHPEDDLVLAMAASASVNYLITGDTDLLTFSMFQVIMIVSPRAFHYMLSGTKPAILRQT